MAKKSVERMAYEADGRRHCDKCEFFNMCNSATLAVCSRAFVEGYKKGYKKGNTKRKKYEAVQV